MRVQKLRETLVGTVMGLTGQHRIGQNRTETKLGQCFVRVQLKLGD